MKKTRHRIVSLTLVYTLLIDPSARSLGGCQSEAPATNQQHRFQEEALAVPSVVQRIYSFRPFLSIWTFLNPPTMSRQFFDVKLDKNKVAIYHTEAREGYYSEEPILGGVHYNPERSKALTRHLAALVIKNHVISGETFKDQATGRLYHVFFHDRFGNKPLILDDQFHQQMVQHLGADRMGDDLFLKNLVSAMDAREANNNLFGDLKNADIPAYVLVVLDASQSLFENDTQGFIGANKILFDKMAADHWKRKRIIQSFLMVGLTHELRHKNGVGTSEEEETLLAREDIFLLEDLLQNKTSFNDILIELFPYVDVKTGSRLLTLLSKQVKSKKIHPPNLPAIFMQAHGKKFQSNNSRYRLHVAQDSDQNAWRVVIDFLSENGPQTVGYVLFKYDQEWPSLTILDAQVEAKHVGEGLYDYVLGQVLPELTPLTLVRHNAFEENTLISSYEKLKSYGSTYVPLTSNLKNEFGPHVKEFKSRLELSILNELHGRKLHVTNGKDIDFALLSRLSANIHKTRLGKPLLKYGARAQDIHMVIRHERLWIDTITGFDKFWAEEPETSIAIKARVEQFANEYLERLNVSPPRAVIREIAAALRMDLLEFEDLDLYLKEQIEFFKRYRQSYADPKEVDDMDLLMDYPALHLDNFHSFLKRNNRMRVILQGKPPDLKEYPDLEAIFNLHIRNVQQNKAALLRARFHWAMRIASRNGFSPFKILVWIDEVVKLQDEAVKRLQVPGIAPGSDEAITIRNMLRWKVVHSYIEGIFKELNLDSVNSSLLLIRLLGIFVQDLDLHMVLYTLIHRDKYFEEGGPFNLGSLKLEFLEQFLLNKFTFTDVGQIEPVIQDRIEKGHLAGILGAFEHAKKAWDMRGVSSPSSKLPSRSA